MVDGHERETEPLPSSGATSFDPLISALSYLISSERTGGASYEGRTKFAASFAALVEWADRASLIHPESDFPFLWRETDGKGQEHEAWFDETRGLWLKATYHNQFGIPWGANESATAQEYLQRLVLQNDFFGDDIHLEAIVQCGSRIRVLTSQPHVAGDPATPSEISDWFICLGFQKLAVGGSVAWYNIGNNLLIADAHEGNVLKTLDGTLLPIDLNIIRPTGKMLFEVRSHLMVEPDYIPKISN